MKEIGCKTKNSLKQQKNSYNNMTFKDFLMQKFPLWQQSGRLDVFHVTVEEMIELHAEYMEWVNKYKRVGAAVGVAGAINHLQQHG